MRVILLRQAVVLRARARNLVAATARDWVLLALAGLYVVSVAAAFLGDLDLAAPCLVGVNVGLVVLDLDGFITLGHRVSWREMDAFTRLGVALVLAALWLAPVSYLDWAIPQAWERWRTELGARAEELARLERELGHAPGNGRGAVRWAALGLGGGAGAPTRRARPARGRRPRPTGHASHPASDRSR